MSKLHPFLVPPEKSLIDVMQQIDCNTRGIALVVNAAGRLLDTVTDGDMRRAVLAGVDLGLPVSSLMSRRSSPPVCAPVETAKAEQLRIMQQHKIRHLPLMGRTDVLVDLVMLEDLIGDSEASPILAVIMAGGEGARLRPLTNQTPKPMLPVAEKPLLEHTIQQLRAAGIQQLYLATHYQAEKFSNYFGNGQDFGISIAYLEEKEPLGTAGALSKLPPPSGPVLIVNGDIVTNMNYRSMLNFHQENDADMTVAVRQYEFKVPYGVVSTHGVEVCSIIEKPVQQLFVNAGIYLVEPGMCELVPRSRFDMTDLIAKLMDVGKRVIAFPIREYWIDVGEMESYEKAQAHALKEMQES